MNVAIWGCGEFGKYVYEQIKGNKQYNIVAWVDSNLDLLGNRIEGIPIISTQEANERVKTDIDMVLLAFLKNFEVLKKINNEKAYRYGFIKKRVLRDSLQLSDNLLEDRNIIWSNSGFLKKPILPKVQTNVVDYCNLNCKGCSHYSNLFQKGEKVPFEVFCKDLEQLSKNVFIYQFDLLGGEVLLEEKIVEYIEFSRRILPHSDISLVTNGLLLPKQTERFFKSCIDNDIFIIISGYKPTLKIKDKIEEVLQKWGIKYMFWHNVTEFLKSKNLSGSSNGKEAMKQCLDSTCHFLRYGKLYKCPIEALSNKLFQHYGLDIRFEGGIDIYDENIDWQEEVRKICEEPVDACRYCGVEEKIEWSVTNNPELEDWIALV